MRGTISERFWPKVNIAGKDECWTWNASKDNHGYGKMSGPVGSSPLRAHRVSWEIHNGKIPEGLVVCHKCDNPPCVNPAHLFVGTQKDNTLDASRKGRVHGDLPLLRGERNGSARLTDDDADSIRREYAEDDAATQTSVSKSAIARITLGISFRNIEGERMNGNARPRPWRRRFCGDELDEIISHHKESGSSRKTAAAFGTNKTTILKIIRGEYVVS